MQRKIRQSQAVVPFGVGAIYDFKGESLVGCDTYRWGGRGQSIQSERLASVLGVTEFRSAPAVDSSSWAPTAAGVPYSRFPTWLFCQKCRRMVHWRRSLEQADKAPTCGACTGNGKKQLVPMRWIQICSNGHMDDVDWVRWAHSRDTGPEARQCQRETLIFETIKGLSGGGFDSLQVRCQSCNSHRNLMGITTKGSLKTIGVVCGGRQPWQRFSEGAECEQIPLVVQRGASNVYFPLVHSSIEIPNPLRSDAFGEKALEIKADEWFRPLMTTNEDSVMAKHAVMQLAQSHKVTEMYIRALIRDEKQRETGRTTSAEATPGDLLSEEWAAFLSPADNADDKDFRTRHVNILSGRGGSDGTSELLGELIDKVVLADRLREVRALEGFHRVTPGTREGLVRTSLTHKVNWLPAVDARGEGIFLSLNESRLSIWEERSDVRNRVAGLETRLDASFMGPRLRERTGPVLRPRYVLLHTLAHILIRRLSFESGYSASSLRERIYARSSTTTESGTRQAGLLIYTAAGGSEGTLGGLVRQGEPEFFRSTVLEAVQDAMWCSSDPLCSENSASSFASLNISACHACTLVAETSCESSNFLLDRALLIGSDNVEGFFKEVLESSINLAGEGISGIG